MSRPVHPRRPWRVASTAPLATSLALAALAACGDPEPTPSPAAPDAAPAPPAPQDQPCGAWAAYPPRTIGPSTSDASATLTTTPEGDETLFVVTPLNPDRDTLYLVATTPRGRASFTPGSYEYTFDRPYNTRSRGNLFLLTNQQDDGRFAEELSAWRFTLEIRERSATRLTATLRASTLRAHEPWGQSGWIFASCAAEVAALDLEVAVPAGPAATGPAPGPRLGVSALRGARTVAPVEVHQ